MDDDDRRQVEVDGGAAVVEGFQVDAEHHHHAMDIGRGGDVDWTRYRLGAEVPEVAEVHGLRVERGMIAVVGQGIAIRRLADVVGVGVRRRWHGAAGVRVERTRLQRGRTAGVPADLLVEPVVVAQGPPGRAADFAFRGAAVEDRGGDEGIAIERDPHRDGFDAVRGPGRRRAGVAAAEFGEVEGRIAQLEGQGEVALQAAVVGVREHAGGAGR